MNQTSQTTADADASIPFIGHAGVAPLIEQLDRCRESFGSKLVQNLRLEGVSGVGKTSAMKAYAARHPPVKELGRTRIPIVFATIPARPTPKSVTSSILSAMGAMSPDYGTTDHQSDRVADLFHRCGVELLMLDEVHHYLDRGSIKTYGAAADEVKILIDKTRVPTVLAGAPRMRTIFVANNQLRSRFQRKMRVRPFHLDDEAGLEALCSFIYSLRSVFDQTLSELMSDNEFCLRTFYASDGITRSIVNLLREIEVMVQGGKPADLATASDAFENAIWPGVEDFNNPYSPEFELRRLDKPGEPYEPSPLDGSNH
jgi:hypothetical protein